MKHNNVIPNVHLRKHWQKRVRCYFNQAAQKKIRLQRRQARASQVFPRPTETLRPVCRGQTRRYNRQFKLGTPLPGRGFSLSELRSAKIHPAQARSIGIAVDHRRQNRSQQSHDLNVQRLQQYLNNLVVYKLHGKDQANENVKVAQTSQNGVLPLPETPRREKGVFLTKQLKSYSAYQHQRTIRTEQKWNGIRQKRAAEAAKKE